MKNEMKRYLLLPLFFMVFFTTALAQQKVKDNTVADTRLLPDESAILELESSTKGLLHARLALTRTDDAAPLLRHIAGMMVYNTASVNDVKPGIYFNDGTRWRLVATGEALSIAYNPTTQQLTFVDEAGNPQAVDLPAIVKANETVTTLRDNGDGTVTYVNESGDEVTVDLLEIAGTVTVAGENVQVTPVTSGNKTEFIVEVPTANGVNKGVVKEADHNPTVTINERGELAVNLEHLNAIKEVSDSYVATLDDDVLLGNARDGNIVITLPPPAANKGKRYTIKKQDSNENTYVNVEGAIEGQITLYTALPYTGWQLMSDGTEWKIITKF